MTASSCTSCKTACCNRFDAHGICGVPVVRRLIATAINLRVGLTIGAFIDAFLNEQTMTTAFALIQEDRRVFGADNTGGWHVHPFENPDEHVPITDAMSFAEFVSMIERHYGDR